ncbi:MAG: DUF6240 domain-containing protein [Lachnospiraceae bacterium]|nr:DUF6240 domain-containing protein [Lachnospiraceae bacterium]
MKITFEGQDNITPFKYIGNAPAEKQASEEAGFNAVSMSAQVSIGNNPGAAFSDASKHTLLAGARRDAAVQESGVLSDYRIVMAHTLSGDDLRKAYEEGFDLKNMSSEDSVTILDKVKAEAAKGGTVVRGFNDDLDGEVLESGANAGLESIIKNALASHDLPATEDNISEVGNAIALAADLDAPAESQIAYMIENDLGTTIRDFYVAHNAAPERASSFRNPADLDTPDMRYVKESMLEAGKVLEDPEEGYMRAEWLFERNLPVTRENILKEKEIAETAFPVSDERAADAAACAIADGLEADAADLSGQKSVYEKASALYEDYFSEEKFSAADITHQRKIQEIRLSMTAEVNVQLIRSGFAIETAPIEELLNELKIAEQAVALKYFPETAGVTAHGDNAPGMSIGSPEDAVRAYRLYNEVNAAVAEMPDSPASALGMFVPRASAEIAFREFEEIALGEKDKLRKAGESYEALMTEVRTDLGDSLKKAFGSVDGIVKDLGLDLNDENRRHVRILAYNRIEMSVQNVEKIAEADRLVTGIIDRMKPAAVLDMIRNGINPLEKSFDEIGRFLDGRQDLSQEYGKASEDYARFLYALDKNKEITAEERESFIGIYRMIDKIEKRDGAAIGAVVETGAELQFSSLLSAVRSSRFKGMDIRVDDNIGFSEIRTTGRSITDQIMASFEGNAGEYYEEQAEEVRRAARVSDESLAFVNGSGESTNAENLNAAENLLSADDDFFKALLGTKEKKQPAGKENEKLREEAGHIMEKMAGSEDGAEEYAKAMEEFKSVAENMTFEADSVIDVRAMQQVNRQISLAVSAAREGADEFFVPVEIGGEMTKVRVSFRDSEDGSSSVNISFRTPLGNDCSAHFDAAGKTLSGYVSLSSGEELKKMQSAVDIFTADLRSGDREIAGEIGIFTNEDMRNASGKVNTGREAGADRQEGAGRKELFGISEDFLKAVGESFYEDQL